MKKRKNSTRMNTFKEIIGELGGAFILLFFLAIAFIIGVLIINLFPKEFSVDLPFEFIAFLGFIVILCILYLVALIIYIFYKIKGKLMKNEPREPTEKLPVGESLDSPASK